MENHKISVFHVLSDIRHTTYNLRCYLKKQTQSFDRLRIGFGVSSFMASEYGNPASSATSPGQENKANFNSRIQNTGDRRQKEKMQNKANLEVTRA